MPPPSRTTKAEAKFNVTTEFPHLGLHSAASTGNIGLVKYALSHGQPVNSVLDGVLPLHAAASGGNDLVVKLLIQYGADVNAPRLPRRYSSDKHRDSSAPIVGESGSTPLHFAAANGHTAVVSTLLQHGAQADRPDKRGTTPEMLARQEGWLECADLLRDWVSNRDREFKESFDNKAGGSETQKANGASAEPAVNESPLDGGGSIKHRHGLQVKHSIDNTLSTLRSTLHNRSESHLLTRSTHPPTASNQTQTPPSPSHQRRLIAAVAYTFHPASTQSSDDLQSPRRPSLSDVMDKDTSPARFASARVPRRPQSAGTGADRPGPDVLPQRKLGSKYSLLNLFKRAAEQNSPQHHSPGHVSPSDPSSHSPARVSRLRMGSDPSSSQHSPTARPSTAELRSSLFHHTRDHSAPNLSKPLPVLKDSGEDSFGHENNDGDHSLNKSLGSPLAQHYQPPSSLLRPVNSQRLNSMTAPPPSQLQQPQYRPLRLDAEYAPLNRSSSPAGRGRRHRMDLPTFGSNVSSPPPRSMRSGSASSLRANATTVDEGCIAESPLTASPTERIHIDVEEEEEGEEEEYGHHVWRSEKGALRPRGDSFASVSSSSSLSPISPQDAQSSTEFQLGINHPLPHDASINGHQHRKQQHLSVPRSSSFQSQSKESRNRGDSVSSESTDGSNNPQLSLSGTTATSSESGTMTPSHRMTLRPSEFSNQGLGLDQRIWDSEGISSPSAADLLESCLTERRAQAPLDLSIRSISSHAQAEALVQLAQKSILDMAESPSTDGPPGLGRSPLSAMLAAYGESLALQRRLKEEEERSVLESGNASSPVSASQETPLESPTSRRSAKSIFQESPARGSLDQQQTLERHSSKTRRQDRRRPNTSSGTAADHRNPTHASSLLSKDRPTRQLSHHNVSALHPRSERLPRTESPTVIIDADSGGSSSESSSHAPAPLTPSSKTTTPPSFSNTATLIRSHTPDPERDSYRDSDSDAVKASLDESVEESTEGSAQLTGVLSTPVSKAVRGQGKRDIASANKLSRMGFATTDGWQPREVLSAATSSPRAPNAGKSRLLKSLMQTFKGKP